MTYSTPTQTEQVVHSMLDDFYSNLPNRKRGLMPEDVVEGNCIQGAFTALPLAVFLWAVVIYLVIEFIKVIR